MERVENFKKCIKKLPDFEKFLSKNNEHIISIPRTNEIYLSYFTRGNNNEKSRAGLVDNMNNNEIRVLALQSSIGSISNHSVILIKNKYLENNDWSIFDSNSPKNFPFDIITKNSKKKFSKIAKYKFMEISPKKSINFGSELKNPGFCGIFGIIFMIFFNKNCNNLNWVSDWKKILKFLEKNENGIELAAEVQKIISDNSGHYKIEKLINNLLLKKFNNILISKNNKTSKKNLRRSQRKKI